MRLPSSSSRASVRLSLLRSPSPRLLLSPRRASRCTSIERSPNSVTDATHPGSMTHVAVPFITTAGPLIACLNFSASARNTGVFVHSSPPSKYTSATLSGSGSGSSSFATSTGTRVSSDASPDAAHADVVDDDVSGTGEVEPVLSAEALAERGDEIEIEFEFEFEFDARVAAVRAVSSLSSRRHDRRVRALVPQVQQRLRRDVVHREALRREFRHHARSRARPTLAAPLVSHPRTARTRRTAAAPRRRRPRAPCRTRTGSRRTCARTRVACRARAR